VTLLHIEIEGGRKSVEEMLDHLDSAMSPIGMQLFLNGRVAPYLRERAEARFANEGDDVVGKWRPLSEATEAWRAHHGFGPSHPINRRTGALEDYITGSPSAVTSPTTGTSVLTYPDQPPGDPILTKKVRTAQRGWDQPNTPARPVLGMNERDLVFVLTQLAMHIQSWDTRIT
jgi:hypothetical protein